MSNPSLFPPLGTIRGEDQTVRVVTLVKLLEAAVLYVGKLSTVELNILRDAANTEHLKRSIGR